MKPPSSRSRKKPISPAQLIRAEYLKRRRKNSAYSLRSFSRDASVSPSVISEVFSGKRQLTIKTLQRIVASLDLDLQTRQRVLQAQDAGGSRNIVHLADERFRLVADWYHFAILSLVQTHDFRADVYWIARRLGISTTETAAAIDRLLALGMIVWKDGTLVRTYAQVITETDKASSALKLSHRQSILQALDCLESMPVAQRDITSLTIPFNLAQMTQVKEMIHKLLVEVNALTRNATDKEEVYNLNVQFVPVTKLRPQSKGRTRS